MSIKILIADDHKLFREGIVNLLSETKEIIVIAQAENGLDAIAKAKEYHPDIVILDIAMPEMNGIEAAEIIREELPDIKIIALSMHAEKHFIKKMLEAGAKGYLFKNCTYNQLIEAINCVYAGEKFLSSEITEVLINDYLGRNEDVPNNGDILSNRELEILKLFACGKATREIAELLFISVKTVGTHKQHILEKLKLKTTTDIVKFALKNGYISL